MNNYQKIANKKRREFKWQTKIKGQKMPAFYLYPFCKNGLSLLVSKYDINTGGIGWYIIDKFTDKGAFRRADIIGCNYGSGIEAGKKETDIIYKKIKSNKIQRREKWKA